MLKIYDKASWHIDAGEVNTEVIEKFRFLFSFLKDKDFLGIEGKEILELGIDYSISIHERMLNDLGNAFMENHYDKVINKTSTEFLESLNNEYLLFCNEIK